MYARWCVCVCVQYGYACVGMHTHVKKQKLHIVAIAPSHKGRGDFVSHQQRPNLACITINKSTMSTDIEQVEVCPICYAYIPISELPGHVEQHLAEDEVHNTKHTIDNGIVHCDECGAGIPLAEWDSHCTAHRCYRLYKTLRWCFICCNNHHAVCAFKQHRLSAAQDDDAAAAAAELEEQQRLDRLQEHYLAEMQAQQGFSTAVRRVLHQDVGRCCVYRCWCLCVLVCTNTNNRRCGCTICTSPTPSHSAKARALHVVRRVTGASTAPRTHPIIASDAHHYPLQWMPLLLPNVLMRSTVSRWGWCSVLHRG